jgi:hypothetical protein
MNYDLKPTANTPKNKIPEISFDANPWKYIFSHIDQVVQNLNTSKIFAGIMIIVLNIGSKFVNIKLSKSIEGYLKYTFSKQILVFAITWMGTRDIYVALIFTILFTLFFECLFNEQSKYCCLPESFTNYHTEMLENEGMQNITSSPVKTPESKPIYANNTAVDANDEKENTHLDVESFMSKPTIIEPVGVDSSISFANF